MALTIGQILKTKPHGVSTARPDDSVQEIATRLAQRRIGAIVIVGEGGRVAGIISERDIIRLIAEHGVRALSMRASEGMTRDVTGSNGSRSAAGMFTDPAHAS